MNISDTFFIITLDILYKMYLNENIVLIMKQKFLLKIIIHTKFIQY